MEEVAELNLRNATLEKKVLRLENENAILRNGCADKASSDLSNTVSVAYTNADVRAKYQPAVQSFLEPLRQYNVKTKYLHTARPCKFLLWVTFVGGGRLPDSLPEFDKFAEQAESAIIVIVQYINTEDLSKRILVDGRRPSGIRLRTDGEERHLLQIVVSGAIGAIGYSVGSQINRDNQEVLLALLERTGFQLQLYDDHAGMPNNGEGVMRKPKSLWTSITRIFSRGRPQFL